MIEAEETQGQPGFKRRIRILKEFKRIGLVDEQIQDFHQNRKLTGDDFTSATGKTNTVSGLAPNKGKGSIVLRDVNYLRSIFISYCKLPLFLTTLAFITNLVVIYLVFRFCPKQHNHV